jgi:hypothetical protein
MEVLMSTLVGKQAVVVGAGMEHYRDPELVVRVLAVMAEA